MTDFSDSWRGRRARLQTFLREHHGAVTTNELHALGFKDSAITRLVDDGILRRYCRGVYVGTGVPETGEQKLRCLLMRAGDDTALARRSAAFHRGHLQFEPTPTQILVPGTSGFRKDPVIERHAASNLQDGDITELRGLRTSSDFRTILDLASEAETEPGRRVLRRVLRSAASQDQGLVTRLRKAVDTRTFAGSALLGRELGGGLERTLLQRSNVEDRFVELCQRFGLPVPATNAVVFGLELDAYWEAHGAFVEIDTYGTHGDEVSFERDRSKIASLLARGLRGFGVTDRRIDHSPAQVAADVRGLLGLR